MTFAGTSTVRRIANQRISAMVQSRDTMLAMFSSYRHPRGGRDGHIRLFASETKILKSERRMTASMVQCYKSDLSSIFAQSNNVTRWRPRSQSALSSIGRDNEFFNSAQYREFS